MTPGWRAGLAAVVMLAAVAATGCGEQRSDDATATSSDPPSGSADRPAPEQSRTTPQPTPEPTPDPTPVDATGPLVFPETDPSTWPPNPMGDTSPEGREANLALWGPRAECAPFSLILDYDAGLLSPEEYTAYAVYAMAPSLPSATVGPTEMDLPERYVLCDQESLEALGFAAGVFIEDINPTFRDQLWLAVMGQTYTDATRPLTAEEVDEALAPFMDAVEQP